MKSKERSLHAALVSRFGEEVAVPEGLSGLDTLLQMAKRATHRSFAEKSVDPALVRLLCACALSAPSKSDLQQADIVTVKDPGVRHALAQLIGSMDWIENAPVFLVVCGNGRRLRQVSEHHGIAFANDHLDAVFNPAVDAGLVLANLLLACEAVGLKTCPISVIRNHCTQIREWLSLPPLVFPVAGLCIGWPCVERAISPRLPLDVTLHEDRHVDEHVLERIDSYDRERGRKTGWDPNAADFRGWSRQKAEMYAVAQRDDFGAFLTEQGFRLE